MSEKNSSTYRRLVVVPRLFLTLVLVALALPALAQEPGPLTWLGWYETLVVASIPFAVGLLKWSFTRMPEWLVVYMPMAIAAVLQFFAGLDFGEGSFGWITVGALSTVLRQVAVKGVARPLAALNDGRAPDRATPLRVRP